MPKLTIDGVGTFNVDDHFRDLSPEDQQKTVDEIIEAVGGPQRSQAPSPTPDFARIRRNVSKMIDQNAPESDIDQYLSEEGVTASQMRDYGRNLSGSPSRPERNNNPGNLKALPNGRSWPGQVDTDSNGYAVFKDRASGERAADSNLQSYAKRGINTVSSIVSRWAPPSDGNDTASYVSRVSKALGVHPDEPLNLSNPQVRQSLLNRGIFPSEGPSQSGQSSVSPASVPSRLLAADGSELAIPQLYQPRVSKLASQGSTNGQSAFNDGLQKLVDQGAARAAIDTYLKNNPGFQALGLDDALAARDRGFHPPVISGGNGGVPSQANGSTDGTKTGSSPQVGKGTAALLGLGDSASFGFLDEGLAGLSSLIDGTPYSSNLKQARDWIDQARTDHPGYSTAGEVAGALIPGAGAFKGLSLAERLADTAKLSKTARAALAGGLGGSAYGVGEANGDLTDRALGGAVGGVTGAVGGVALNAAGRALSPVVDRLLPNVAQARVTAAQANNPNLPVDSIVSQDLKAIVDRVDARDFGSGRPANALKNAAVLSHVNDLEQSYLPYADVKALNTLSPTDKLILTQAMDRARTIAPEDIDALRGTPAGDAVADGISRVQSLRSMVPVPSASNAGSNGGRSAIRIGGEAAATGLGAMVAGPKGAMLARLAASTIGQGAGADTTKAVVSLARAKAASAPMLARAVDNLGILPATDDSFAALSSLASKDRDASYLASKAQQAEASKLADANRRISITNNLDNVPANGGWRGYLQDQSGLAPKEQDIAALRMLTNGKINLDQFKAHLDSPDALQPGGAGLAIADRMKAMGDAGELPRMDGWSLPSSSSPSSSSSLPSPALALVDDSGGALNIRNPIAYQEAARGAQDRVTSAFQAVLAHPKFDAATKETVGTAVSKLGTTKSQSDANDIVQAALAEVPEDQHADILSILSPIAAGIKEK